MLIHAVNTSSGGHLCPPGLAVLPDGMTTRCSLLPPWRGCHPTASLMDIIFQAEMDKNHLAGKAMAKVTFQLAQLLA